MYTYQEALDFIIKVAENKESIVYSGIQFINCKNKLQELINKDKPVELVKWDNAVPETRCSICGRGIYISGDDEYCPNCGKHYIRDYNNKINKNR